MFPKLQCSLVELLAASPALAHGVSPLPQRVYPATGRGLGATEPPRLPEAWAVPPGPGSPFLAAAVGGFQGLQRLRAQSPAWPGPAPQVSVCCLKINLSVQNKTKPTETDRRAQKVCVYFLSPPFPSATWPSLVAQLVKNPPAVQETWV